MAEELKVGCQRPSMENNKRDTTNTEKVNIKEEKQSMIKVGKPAPDFKASAFHEGKFTSVNLSDYKGKWVLLCFYPGDFTFV